MGTGRRPPPPCLGCTRGPSSSCKTSTGCGRGTSSPPGRPWGPAFPRRTGRCWTGGQPCARGRAAVAGRTSPASWPGARGSWRRRTGPWRTRRDRKAPRGKLCFLGALVCLWDALGVRQTPSAPGPCTARSLRRCSGGCCASTCGAGPRRGCR